jgi:probable LLM family oxidoreductase
MIKLGIDSFASTNREFEESEAKTDSQIMSELIDHIILADEVGLDRFGIGEHHRAEFLDSSPALILAAAARETKSITLSSAVTVLSTADPVRIFQQYATLDIISNGRAEVVVGRGSFSEAFPLFGVSFNDYDAIFEEKLELLLAINSTQPITWSGNYRPTLENQYIYPRPVQNKLPIWRGVGGSPESFIRAGTLGIPLMIAIIGGQTHRFRPYIDLYKEAGKKAGHPPENLKVGIHALGYVAEDAQQAREDFFPGYQKIFTKIGKERGWGATTRAHFDSMVTEKGALLVGSPEEVAHKIQVHSESLGGIDCLNFQLNVAALAHNKCLEAIKLIGKKVKPLLSQSK